MYKNVEVKLRETDKGIKVVVASSMLTYSNLATLDGTTWLNDAVTHACLGLLSEERLSAPDNLVYVLPFILAYH